jgi:hypothetical protein
MVRMLQFYRYAAHLPDHYGLTMTPCLSGVQLLSNQIFRELFPTETIIAGEGLAVNRLAAAQSAR